MSSQASFGSRVPPAIEIRGRARLLGDHVSTDHIIASSRKAESLDPHRLKRWLLEAVDPTFAGSVGKNDVLVAGSAFGCGSAMEVAVTVVLAAGIRVIVANSFSRTYFRNAVNNGLLPVRCDTSPFREGDELVIRMDSEGMDVERPADGLSVKADALPPFIMGILAAGGLVPYLRDRRGFGAPQ